MSRLIIAEAGISHLGNMSLAKNLIHLAKWAGCDIWKTQLYDVDKVFPNKQVMVQGRDWYEMVKRTQLTKEQTFQLAEWCKEEEIEFLASAFDVERLGWLEEIGVRRHKIASRSITNEELFRAIGKTGKDVLVSLGMWSGATTSLKAAPYMYNTGKTFYLYCISKYPTPLSETKLLDVNFRRYSGFSDHTIGTEAAIVALARGAQIIEKHFVTSRQVASPDTICSATPEEMKRLVDFARKLEEMG